MKVKFTRDNLLAAFKEWHRREKKSPEEFVSPKTAPAYAKRCVSFLEELISEVPK
jgi:broad specificity phosphatase PhoE